MIRISPASQAATTPAHFCSELLLSCLSLPLHHSQQGSAGGLVPRAGLRDFGTSGRDAHLGQETPLEAGGGITVL